jgi:hypothetical protein
MKPPLTDLPIKTADTGFYGAFSVNVTVVSKIIISVLVVWCIFWPVQAGAMLSTWNAAILNNFAAWYIWVVAFFVIVCLGLAIWPTAGRLNLGQDGEKPEFSNFSWFSMMFGAGIGVWDANLGCRRAYCAFQKQPSGYSRRELSFEPRQRARGLCLVLPSLGSGGLGVLRGGRSFACVL